MSRRRVAGGGGGGLSKTGPGERDAVTRERD